MPDVTIQRGEGGGDTLMETCLECFSCHARAHVRFFFHAIISASSKLQDVAKKFSTMSAKEVKQSVIYNFQQRT